MIGPRSNRLPRGLAPDEAASYWLVRMDGRPLPEQDQAAFDAWCAESKANADAIARARSVWGIFDDAAGDPHLDAVRESALAAGPEPRRSLWLALGAGMAAMLFAAFLLGTVMLPQWRGAETRVTAASQSPRHSTVAVKPDRGTFRTAKGERRTFELADGSSITLNTDSAMRVSFTAERRMISMLRGQALFEVAKNRARPFVVKAGDRQITALGTVFEIRLDPDRMRVTLIEGKVVVDGLEGEPRLGGVIVPTVLTPGEELIAMLGAPQTLAKVDVDQQLRWRDGFVEFEDTPLSSVVREMNRYSDRQLVIDDPKTGALRISGIFRTGDPMRFAAIVGELLPVSARNLADGRIELSTAPAAVQ